MSNENIQKALEDIANALIDLSRRRDEPSVKEVEVTPVKEGWRNIAKSGVLPESLPASAIAEAVSALSDSVSLLALADSKSARLAFLNDGERQLSLINRLPEVLALIVQGDDDFVVRVGEAVLNGVWCNFLDELTSVSTVCLSDVLESAQSVFGMHRVTEYLRENGMMEIEADDVVRWLHDEYHGDDEVRDAMLYELLDSLDVDELRKVASNKSCVVASNAGLDDELNALLEAHGTHKFLAALSNLFDVEDIVCWNF
jgi:hypothetical protein